MRCSAPSRVLAAQRCASSAKHASTSLPPQAAPKAAPPHTDARDAAPLSRRAALGAAAALLACAPHAARCAVVAFAYSNARSQADTHVRSAQTALTHQRRCCSWRRWRPRFLQARAPSSSPVCLTTRLMQRATGYVESVRRVVASLSESIAFEATGASEREVRRKADPVKADIERFLRDWKGSPLVAAEPSYAAVVGTLCAATSRACVLTHIFCVQRRCDSWALSTRRAARAPRSRRTCATRCWPRCATRPRRWTEDAVDDARTAMRSTAAMRVVA